MNILVIGGAGYVGSHQVKLLCDKGYNTFVFDNLNTGHIAAIDSRAIFIEGDIRDYEFLVTTLNDHKIDAVIHFAALSLVGESVLKPLDYYNNNVYGMEVLLKAMVTCDVKKIIFSSTAATYGIHEVMPIDETYITNPINPYGDTKLAMEKMMRWVSEAHGIKSIALRYFNVAGADVSATIGEAHNPETHLLPIVLQVATGKRESIAIYGDDYNTPDGTCIRDYVHVTDLVDAHLLALNYLGEVSSFDVFNIGYGHGFSVKEIIESARKVTGHKIPAIVHERRSGDPAYLVSSCEKIKDVLKWQPQFDNIEVIIESAYNWHKGDGFETN